jgi:hypothetical protein
MHATRNLEKTTLFGYPFIDTMCLTQEQLVCSASLWGLPSRAEMSLGRHQFLYLGSSHPVYKSTVIQHLWHSGPHLVAEHSKALLHYRQPRLELQHQTSAWPLRASGQTQAPWSRLRKARHSLFPSETLSFSRHKAKLAGIRLFQISTFQIFP